MNNVLTQDNIRQLVEESDGILVVKREEIRHLIYHCTEESLLTNQGLAVFPNPEDFTNAFVYVYCKDSEVGKLMEAIKNPTLDNAMYIVDRTLTPSGETIQEIQRILKS